MIEHNVYGNGKPPRNERASRRSTVIVPPKLDDSSSRTSLKLPERTPRSKGPIPLKVLVAEPSSNCRKVMELFLSNGNHKVKTARTPDECVNYCQNEKFDLVILNTRMPMETGTTILRRIREGTDEGKPDQRVPVIAVDAEALRGNRERLLQRGFDDYLSKPIRKTELDQIVNSINGRESP